MKQRYISQLVMMRGPMETSGLQATYCETSNVFGGRECVIVLVCIVRSQWISAVQKNLIAVVSFQVSNVGKRMRRLTNTTYPEGTISRQGPTVKIDMEPLHFSKWLLPYSMHVLARVVLLAPALAPCMTDP
jgi:hypothetical protein